MCSCIVVLPVMLLNLMFLNQPVLRHVIGRFSALVDRLHEEVR